LVPHFHVPQIPPLQTGAANSCPAFSAPAFLTVPHFHVSHFQSPQPGFKGWDKDAVAMDFLLFFFSFPFLSCWLLCGPAKFSRANDD